MVHTDCSRKLAVRLALMTKQSVDRATEAIDAVVDVLVAVATGKRQIESASDPYAASAAELDAALAALDIENPNPFYDLWEWHRKWSSDLPGYADRRAFVASLFRPTREELRTLSRPSLASGVSGTTPWVRINAQLEQLRQRYRVAKTADDYQAIGHLCRETLVTLGREAFDPSSHLPAGEVPPGTHDAKKRLALIFQTLLPDGRDAHVRAIAAHALDEANAVQHRPTATKTEAAIAADATILTVSLANTLLSDQIRAL
jgi:hypothetical protein